MFEKYAERLELCNTCPSLCQSACPVVALDGNRAHSPWGLMQVMNQVRTGQIGFSQEVAELAYECLTCKACTTQCEHGNQISPVLLEARKEAVHQGLAPDSILGYAEKFHRHNNPFSKDLLKKLHEILPESALQNEGDICYYASCTTIAKTPEIITDTFELFEKLGIDYVVPYTETIQCCGYPLKTAGAHDEFMDIAEINFHSLKKYKKIITGSPACAFTLKRVYRRHDLSLENKVETVTDFLSSVLKTKKLKLKKDLPKDWMYHDPCYMSRYLEQTQTPRDLIQTATGEAPLEFHDNQAESKCSGQSGCYNVVHKDRSDAITKERLRECKENEVQNLVTHCPSCVFKMQQSNKNMVVKDIVSLLNESIVGVKK